MLPYDCLTLCSVLFFPTAVFIPAAHPTRHIHSVCLFLTQPSWPIIPTYSLLHLLLFVPITIFPFHVSLLLSTQRGIHLFPISPAFSYPYNTKHEIFYSSHVLPFNTASTLHNIPIRKPVLFPISCRHYVTGYTEIHTGWENNLVYCIQNVTIFSAFWPYIYY